MQFDRLTIRSQEAIQETQHIASEENQQEISPSHLLLAVLMQQEGVAKPLLDQAGVSPASLEHELREQIRKIPRLQGTMPSPPVMGRELHSVLTEAFREADVGSKRGIHVQEKALPTPPADGCGALFFMS